jgi:hypothetical protein
VTAVVTDAKSLESAFYVVVTTEFRNASSVAVTVRSYEIVWPKGRFVVPDLSMRIAPGAVVKRTARVGVDSGALDLLTADSARASVLDAR